MRLVITILWLVAAVCWTPWLLLVLRYAIDLAMGIAWDTSLYYKPALIGFWPGTTFGWWPPLRWLSWNVISVWPLTALFGVILSAVGWRLYWLNESGILTRRAPVVAASIIAPLLAPFIMWGDAKKRHKEKEAYLENEVVDANQRLAN